MELIALATAVVFGLIHLFGSWLNALDEFPRSWWLSASSGTSVAYVFFHLLPAIAHEGKIALGDVWMLERLEAPSLSIALLGLVVFYGLEQLARGNRSAHALAHDRQEAEDFHD
jgi:xanthine/uracil/vitamin C permease (AzgA family)